MASFCDSTEDQGPATVCSVIRGCGGREGEILLFEALPAAAADAHHPARVVALGADPRGLVRLRVERHHVRDVDRALLLDHAADLAAALNVADRARLLVPLLDVQPLDEHT